MRAAPTETVRRGHLPRWPFCLCHGARWCAWQKYGEHQTKKPLQRKLQRFVSLAEWTGLEPATPGVTGRYSNRLNYHSASV